MVFTANIGSHGTNHASIHNRQSSSVISNELNNSKKLIEDKLGECRYFSFPNGSMVDMSIDAIKQVSNAGYELAFSAEKKHQDENKQPLDITQNM